MRTTGFRLGSAAVCLCVCMVSAPPAQAADKDMIELQRQMAALNERVNNVQALLNTLQSTMAEKLGGQATLLQQALEGVNQIHAANVAAAKTLSDALSQQQQKIEAPVAALNARLDQIVQTTSTTQESITEMNSRLGKMEQRLVDMENLMHVLQAPAPQVPGGPPAGVTAQGLFQDATRDQLSGKTDLAMEEFQNYLKYFGDTESAAGAQFHIGEMLLQQGKPDQAVQAFDMVAGQFPMSAKAPDALYQKAQALKQQNRRTQAAQVLNQLVRQYPDSDAAAKAKADLAHK